MTTGLTILSPELNAKRLDVLRDLVQSFSRVAALWDASAARSQITATEEAARSLKAMRRTLRNRNKAKAATRHL
jgi:hypothetical protein